MSGPSVVEPLVYGGNNLPVAEKPLLFGPCPYPLVPWLGLVSDPAGGHYTCQCACWCPSRAVEDAEAEDRKASSLCPPQTADLSPGIRVGDLQVLTWMFSQKHL